MAKTAAEFMEELANNEDYAQRMKIQKDLFQQLEEMYSKDQFPIISELNEAGFAVKSVWDFVNRDNDYCDAVPILISHLQKPYHPKTLAGIARSLAIRELSSDLKLWNILIEMYQSVLSDKEISDPTNRGLQMSLAVAIKVLFTKTPKKIEDLSSIISKCPNGDCIEWLQPIFRTSPYKS